MKLEIKAYKYLCELEAFKINGQKANYNDFGDKYDTMAEKAEQYCCANMKFIPKPATQEVLDKYKINADEYNEICKELDCLSLGSCGWCE